MSDIISKIERGELRLMSGKCFGDGKCNIVYEPVAEADLLRLAKLGQRQEAINNVRAKCNTCGGLFRSIGPDDSYEHNWAKCERENAAPPEKGARNPVADV